MEILLALAGLPLGFASFLGFLLSAPYMQGHVMVRLIRLKSQSGRWCHVEREIDEFCFTASKLISRIKAQEGPSRYQMRELMKYLKTLCDLLDESDRLSDEDIERLRAVIVQAEGNLRLTLEELTQKDTTGFPEAVAELEMVVEFDPHYRQAKALQALKRLEDDVGGGGEPQEQQPPPMVTN